MGRVVVVMEHRDGSGMVCHPRSPETNKREPLLYIKAADTSCVPFIDALPIQLNLTSALRYGDDKKPEFRREQLEQRRFEIYAAIDALKKLSVDGDCAGLSTIDDSELDWSDFQGKIGFDTLQLAGHSFGASTLFSILSHEPTEGFAPLPVTHALFLDPWLQPFEKPGPVQASKNSQVRKVILHSEGFTLWREHMAQMVEVAKDWGNVPIYTIGTIYSVNVLRFISSPSRHLARATHQTFSDYIVASPRFLAGKRVELLRKISKLSVAFLDDHMEDVLARSTIRRVEVETLNSRWGKEERRLVANRGDIIIH